MRQGLIAILFLCATAAQAGGLTVTPVKVELDGKARAVVINVKNSSVDAKRYQLEMMNWGESPSGEMELTPTHDIVYFPQLLTLKPGEDRNVRVGITQPPGPIERSYRLFVQELPGMKTEGGAQQVQVLTRVGIPIFVVPAQPQKQVQLTPVSVKAGKASLGLVNQGNAHARPDKVVFTASDAEGRSVFEKTWNGWYILARGKRDYTVEIPPEACKRATSFRVAALGTKLSLSKTVQATPGACGS